MKVGSAESGRHLSIVKLGGSVITKKAEGPRPNLVAIRRLAGEVQKAAVGSLLVVHGAGSFGHQLAFKHRLKEGFKESSQLLGLAETHRSVMELNRLIVWELVRHHVAAFSMPPSSLALTKNGRIALLGIEPVRMALSLGITPVLFGDVVLDEATCFNVLSGDQLMVKLALELSASRIIVGVDVDGLYTADPKRDAQAKLIPMATLRELRALVSQVSQASPRASPSPLDVTGGMVGKVQELIPALEGGIDVRLVNALKPGRLYKALKGEKVIGTTLSSG